MRNIIIISDRKFDDNDSNSGIIKKFLDETVKMNPENCSVTICNVGTIWKYVYRGGYLCLNLGKAPTRTYIRLVEEELYGVIDPVHENEVVAFWDGKNPRTKYLIDAALEYHKKVKVHICRYDKNEI